MKFFARLLPLLLVLSIPALAQHNAHREVGGGYIPKHGPPAFHGTARPPAAGFHDKKAIPKRPTFTPTVNGSATTTAAMKPASISIIPGSTATSRAVSARHIASG